MTNPHEDEMASYPDDIMTDLEGLKPGDEITEAMVVSIRRLAHMARWLDERIEVLEVHDINNRAS